MHVLPSLKKVVAMVGTWGSALVFSFGLRQWGSLHPEPFSVPLPLVLLFVSAPALVLGLWLLVPGKGESVDCEQESL